MLRKLLALSCFAPLATANQLALAPSCSTVLAYGIPNNWCNVSFVGEPGDILLRKHLLVRFDVAQHLPAGSVVNGATLLVSAQGFTDPTNFVVHELLAPACPGAVWSGSPLGLGASAGAPLFTGGSWTTTLTSPTFTSVVDNWFGVPAQNFGLMFAVPVDATLGGEIFYEACVSVTLVVDFTPPPPCPVPVSYCVAAANSQGPNGSHMSITGSTSLAANNLVLVADGVRPGAPGFFYFGATQQQIPLGNGFSCAGNPLFRLATPNLFADANGKLVRPVNFTVGSALNIQPGSVWNFQVKYRDVPGGGARYNFSDGLQITFCP
jgi:hypothetical protein